MTKWYQKEIPDSAVFINGSGMRFDILETSDATLIDELDKCIARGVGGVLSITQEQYAEEAKKKSGRELLRIQLQQQAAEAGAVSPPVGRSSCCGGKR